MAAEVVPQLTAETLATIDELMPEGRALEVEIADYAKRVQEVTTTLLGISAAFPDRNSDGLFAWGRYDDLGSVVEDLRSLLHDAIDDSPPGPKPNSPATSTETYRPPVFSPRRSSAWPRPGEPPLPALNCH